jgi:hypothetical protein
MSQLRACACVLGALLLTGCTAASAAGIATGQGATGPTRATGHATGPADGHADGHVTGKLVMEGGPMGPGGKQPGARPLPGTVTFTAAGHKPVAVKAGAAGKFSAWLRPGRYRVTGRSPDVETQTGSGRAVEQTCSQPSSVTVTADRTVAITVACIVP